ncbi:MAG: flavin reductase family protein [Acetobacteraceae bacterium]|nr:flavin reductase family protein [Acetobacteraceae bacterium]
MDQASPAERLGPTLHDAAAFRRVAGSWATGVAVITTIDADGRPFGLTMNAVSSLSLEPPQFLICVDRRADSLPVLEQSRLFCINLLRRGQQNISRRFATKLTDKFRGVPHRRLASGLPVIDGVIGFVACRVSTLLPGGDHVIVVGDVLEVETCGGEPLVHFRGEYRDLV